VNVETIGAAVDLRGAHLDEFDQTFGQAGAGEIDLDRAQRLVTVGCHVGGRQAFGVHGVVLVHSLDVRIGIKCTVINIPVTAVVASAGRRYCWCHGQQGDTGKQDGQRRCASRRRR
jgi:hypothetical protein